MRRGRYAYRKEEEENKLTRRPQVALHVNFPGPEASDYFGGGVVAERGLALVELNRKGTTKAGEGKHVGEEE